MDFKLPNIKQSTGSPKHNVSNQGFKKPAKIKFPKINHGNHDNHKNIFGSQHLFDKINADEEIKFVSLMKTLEYLDSSK